MAHQSNIILPSLDKAVKDLEESERKYKNNVKKLSTLSTEVEKLKIEKQILKLSAKQNKETITYYQNLLIDTTTKTENVILSQNRAKLVAAHNVENIKQNELKVKSNTLQLHDCAIGTTPKGKLMNQYDDLLVQKLNLEEKLKTNSTKIQELQNKIYL